MDAVAVEGESLQDKIETAQTALARALAKANLSGDPLGPALQAMSDSLGAQLALHQANTGHFNDVAERLDASVASAVRRGEQGLDARRIAIVEALAPELARQTAKNVRAWNRTVTLKTLISYGSFAVALGFGVGMAGYGAGWQAGRTSARDDASILEVVLRQAGPEAEAALVSMVRANNLPVAWAQCRRSANPDKQGPECLHDANVGRASGAAGQRLIIEAAQTPQQWCVM